MKAYWGVDVQLHVFLTSALDGCEWSASRLGRFALRETHWIGGWVGHRLVFKTRLNFIVTFLTCNSLAVG
jgi:hypothetical protein